MVISYRASGAALACALLAAGDLSASLFDGDVPLLRGSADLSSRLSGCLPVLEDAAGGDLVSPLFRPEGSAVGRWIAVNERLNARQDCASADFDVRSVEVCKYSTWW